MQISELSARDSLALIGTSCGISYRDRYQNPDEYACSYCNRSLLVVLIGEESRVLKGTMSWHISATLVDGDAVGWQTPNYCQLRATKDSIRVKIRCTSQYGIRINVRHVVSAVVELIDWMDKRSSGRRKRKSNPHQVVGQFFISTDATAINPSCAVILLHVILVHNYGRSMEDRGSPIVPLRVQMAAPKRSPALCMLKSIQKKMYIPNHPSIQAP